MATSTFDSQTATEKHRAILRDVNNIRDIISNEVYNYYYDRTIDSEAEEQEVRDGMRKHLRIAVREIDELLNGKLY